MSSAPSGSDRSAALTPRQREVLRLQAYGFTYQEISERLGLSIWTVKNHHKQALRSLQLALKVFPAERVRTALACYIMGLLDGGLTAQEVVRRLREVTPHHLIPSATASGDKVDDPDGRRTFAAD
jgi:hypothetical protein